MANNQATGKTAKHGRELTGKTRGCILKAFDILDNRNKPMPELLATAAEQNPLQFMQVASKYIIKDIHNDIDTHTAADKLTDEELAGIIATRAQKGLQEGTEPVTLAVDNQAKAVEMSHSDVPQEPECPTQQRNNVP